MDTKRILSKILKPLACLVIIIAFLMPFGKVIVTFDVLGTSTDYELPFKGFDMVRASGFWGILIFVFMAVVLVFEYIKPLEKYKKIVGFCAASIVIVAIFIGTITCSNNPIKLISSNNATPEIATAVGLIEAAELSGLEFGKALSFGFGFFFALVGAIILWVVSIVSPHDKTKDVNSRASFDLENLGAGFSNESKTNSREKSLKETEKEIELLTKIAELRKAGVLTDEEFEQRKAGIFDKKTEKTTNEADNILEMINKISALNSQGILTDKEFAERKEELMDKYMQVLEK